MVVNYNGGQEVLDCLRALLDSAIPTGSLDVVLLDNGSTDGSPERVGAALPAVRIVRSPRNLGYPAVNQVVADLTGVDAVAIVNPDAVVAPDCLAALAEALTADPGLGAACPLIRLAGRYREVRFGLDGPVRAAVDLLSVSGGGRWHLTGPRVRRRWQDGVAWSVGNGSILRSTGEKLLVEAQAHRSGRLTLTSGNTQVELAVDRHPRRVAIALDGEPVDVVQNAGSIIGTHGLGINRGYHRPDGPDFAVAADVPAWCGAGVLLRSDYLRDAGLFDPRWFLYYEDTDLAWRGLLRGWRYGFVPSARMSHAHSTTIGHGSSLYDVQHGRNRLLTVTKCAPAAEVVATWADAIGLVGGQLRADVAGRVRDRRRPELVLTGRRLRAIARAARQAPGLRADRTAIRSAATVPDQALPILGRASGRGGG